ncbi:MAG: lipopolysaccharide kinase InaA family protein [Phycisphaerales bacterium]
MATDLPPPAILAALRDLHPTRAQVIKRDGDAEVLATELLGQPVIIKRWRARSAYEKLKMKLGFGRANRHARGTRRLQDSGIPTARVLASQLLPEQDGTLAQTLILERLPGKTVLEHLADNDLSPRQQHALARRIALDMAALIRAGYYNRDHKPSNLIVTSTDAADPRAAVIDTVAIRRAGDIGAIRMLASLYIEPLGCGVPPRRALAFRVVRTLANEGLGKPYQQLWMYAGNVIRNHGDAKPKISPLQPSSPVA